MPAEPALRLGVDVLAMPQVEELALEARLRLWAGPATAELTAEDDGDGHTGKLPGSGALLPVDLRELVGRGAAQEPGRVRLEREQTALVDPAQAGGH